MAAKPKASPRRAASGGPLYAALGVIEKAGEEIAHLAERGQRKITAQRKIARKKERQRGAS